VLIACYWGAFLTVSGDPDGGWSRLLSLFPATAPFAMPGRIALGSVTWWEPLLAVALTLAAIAGLVALAGRVYTNAILHSGTTLRLRDAWHSDQAPQPPMVTAPVRIIDHEDTRDPPKAAATDQRLHAYETSSIHRHPDGSEPGEPTGVGRPPRDAPRR
jgi:ABC-2 type transport system permease protein